MVTKRVDEKGEVSAGVPSLALSGESVGRRRSGCEKTSHARDRVTEV
jgi:hypothetical protein